MSNKKQWFFVLLGLVVLTGLLLMLVSLRDRELTQQGADKAGGHVFPLTAIDFAELDLTEIEAGNEIHQAYLVRDLLSSLQYNSNNVRGVIFSSRDGNRIIVSEEEIAGKGVALLPQQGRSGLEYRLMFPQDPFHNRWLKDITAIEIDYR